MNCLGHKWRKRTFPKKVLFLRASIKCDTFCQKGCLFKSLQFLGRKMRHLVWPGGGKDSELTEKAWKKPQTVWGQPVLWLMIIFLAHPSSKAVGPLHDKPGLMRGLPDTFLISVLQFAAALTCRKNLTCTSVRNAEEQYPFLAKEPL